MQELVYGVLRMRARIDYRISSVATRGLDEMDPDALDALRLGVYQLFDLNGVPPYAAVSESVELVKLRKPHLSGFVNGVLKGLQRSGEPRFPDFQRDPVANMRTWHSHPEWLIKRWVRQFGTETAADIADANNQRPALIIQPLTMSAEAAIAVLAEAQITAETLTSHTDGIRLTHGDVTRALELVPGIVQDPAARLVTRYIGAKQSDIVLDVCAAPGGKAVGVAQRARYTVASDISFQRLDRVRDNFSRIRAQDVHADAGLVVADARTPPFRTADIVFIDAPCTGTGTLRRHPDGRWRVRQHDLRALVTLQSEILHASANLVKVGGFLVYATCSLEPEENEEQVEMFLKSVTGFAVAPPPDFPKTLDKRGFLRLLPHEHGYDGAFAARLRRVH
jgi:16S rRNA (cytosine967-C5)-methyltransferase